MKKSPFFILLSALILLCLTSCARGVGCPYSFSALNPVECVDLNTAADDLYCDLSEPVTDCLP